MREKFRRILNGELSDEEIIEVLLAINETGIKAENLVDVVSVIRESAIGDIHAPKNAIDVCGTGGDKLNTLNISTSVAFVVAACGVPVAKHGNRAMSSKSGSADIFSELGIALDSDPEKTQEALNKFGLCFMFAPAYYPMIKNATNARKAISAKTIFNFIGPLLNPAGVRNQLIGIPNGSGNDMAFEVAKAAKMFGINAWIVFGEDGMDEVTISGKTGIYKGLDYCELQPEDFGFQRRDLTSVIGGDAKYNKDRMVELFSGIQNESYREAVLVNSACALVIVGKAVNIRDGVGIASKALDGGKALELLQNLQNFYRN